jgi:transcriptional regulator with XRE-family HTH domain
MKNPSLSQPSLSSSDELVKLGAQLRQLRLARKAKLNDLAQAAGVSNGLLSQLERGVGNPSYLTLTKLATAFGVPINTFFGQDGATEDQYLVRKSERKRLTPARRDVSFELVTPNLRGTLEVLWIVLQPGSEEPNPYEHEGEECVLCLDGTTDYHLGERLYHLEAGDSLTFPGSIPHWAVNPGERPATLVVAITPPSF